MIVSRTTRSLVAVLCVLAGVLPLVQADDTGKKAAHEKAIAKKRPAPVKKAVQLKPETAAKEAGPTVAHIRVSGPVLSSPPGYSLFAGQTQGLTLREWVQRLAKARNDERVKAVLLEIDTPLMNWAQAQELADAIGRLNKVKPVYAHVTAGGALPYLVGSSAREVAMEPTGTLMIVGLGAELMYFKGALDWLGISAQMIQVGRYKGAAEPFTRTQPSAEFRGQYDKVLDDLYLQLCEQIARQRRLTVPHVKQAIDEGPLDAKQAAEYRLVDRLVPKSQWQEYALKKVTAKDRSAQLVANYAAKKREEVDFSNPFAVFSMMMGGRKKTRAKDPTIAVIYAHGMIMGGKSGEGMLGSRYVGSKTMEQCFAEAEKDDNVKAVIFRINSPGGSALASELIYQAARKCARSKPVIVSIAGLGASGGYYIALGGQKVLADPASLVGSIGVVSGKLAMTGLYEKIGLSTFTMTRGQNAGLFLSRRWTEAEQAKMRRLAQRVYNTFTSRVKGSRGKRIKKIEDVAQGRIFTARQAAGNGLIDEVGGFREAVAAACSAAKIKSAHFLTLPRPKTLFDVLYGGAGAAMPTGADALGPLGSALPAVLSARSPSTAGPVYLLELGRLLQTERVLTAMPHYVSIQP